MGNKQGNVGRTWWQMGRPCTRPTVLVSGSDSFTPRSKCWWLIMSSWHHAAISSVLTRSIRRSIRSRLIIMWCFSGWRFNVRQKLQHHLPVRSSGADAATAASTFHRSNFLASSEPARRPRHVSWCSGWGGTARTPIWDLVSQYWPSVSWEEQLSCNTRNALYTHLLLSCSFTPLSRPFDPNTLNLSFDRFITSVSSLGWKQFGQSGRWLKLMCNDTNLAPLFSYKKIAGSFEMNLVTL